MSLFTVAQKRAFLDAALTREFPNGIDEHSPFSSMRNLSPAQCARRLQHCDEAKLDQMITAYIREAAQRIAAHLKVATVTSDWQPV